MLLACIAVSITTVLTLTPSTTVLGKVPLKVPPEELTIRARDLARDLGFTDIPVDVAAGLITTTDTLRAARKPSLDPVPISDSSGTHDWRLRRGRSGSPISRVLAALLQGRVLESERCR